MSEYDENRSPVRSGGGTNSNDNTIAEDANNSIIGKVKSRVSSIIPNRLSKWFSPSANNLSNSSSNNNNNNNDSINGNLSVSVPRRRRRIEIEDDEEEISRFSNRYGSAEDESNQSEELQHYDGNSDDDSNHSAVDLNVSARGRPSASNAGAANALPVIHVRRTPLVRQPPSKRSRMNTTDLDDGVRDSPLLNHHKPLVASTPAVGSNARAAQHTAGPRLSTLRHKQLGAARSGGRAAKEPPYNFASRDSNPGDIDIIDLVPLDADPNASDVPTCNRRSLNIPQFAGLKRQSLYTQRNDELPSTSAGSIPARRTSTTIQETEPETELYANAADSNRISYNGQHNVRPVFVPRKRSKLANGTGDYIAEVDEEPTQCLDTASESSECSAADAKGDTAKQLPHKTGLFNMSGRGGGMEGSMGSRASSSTGNGLNFFSHLEGRKSLFSGSQMSAAANNSLNTSTLSLNALNRRQFNASIYGSTSALSDSRLLNTFSPFYKGRTTYGGAAAYNKYGTAMGLGTGAGASSMRITPTLIRPTSSLSVLSTSSNSLAGAGGGAAAGGENAAISSTAKRILELINDFATPLSEAKKMANNIKSGQLMQQPPSKGRLNESDLNASRAVRLSQVRTPYKRPAAATPLPTSNGKSSGGGVPPTRELQVPSMSQLLQLKKMQSTTERARQIAANSQSTRLNAAGGDYKLAVEQVPADDGSQHHQQKHVNKIKNKLNAAVRSTGSAKDMLDDEPLPPVNLPNIAFPLMQSVPKFDIALPVSAAHSTATAATLKTSTTTIAPTKSTTTTTTTPSFAFKGFATQPESLTPTSPNAITAVNVNATNSSAATFGNVANKSAVIPTASSTLSGPVSFKFAAPLVLPGDYTAHSSGNVTYQFSQPAPLSSAFGAAKQEIPFAKPPAGVPQLKSGSVLDALKKPFVTANTTATSTPATKAANAPPTGTATGFGTQFKKSTNEWECDTCMIRNKQESNKCVACETPRKQTKPVAPPPSALATSSFSSFGEQFKKSAAEWECDACMIRNKQEVSKCVACETPRKQSTLSSSNTVSSRPPSAAPLVTSSFGDAFKPKSNSWECPTCMISNKAEVSACVACETKKPGSTAAAAASTSSAPAPKFSFGFGGATTEKPASMDSTFKSLAAEQAAAKWECEACMTRNDHARSKCVCCEQPKPGTQAAPNAEAPKFAFGMASAKKFSFGFAAAAAPAVQPLNNTSSSSGISTTITSSTAAGTEKTETNPSKGFVFGSAPASSASNTTTTSSNAAGFSFGLKPATTTATGSAASGKDVADSTKATTAFKIGVPSTSTTSTSGFTFGAAAPASTSSVTPAAPTTTALPASTNTTSMAESTAKSVAAAPPTFSFGGSSPATTKSAVAGAGFSFGTAAKADSTAAPSGFGAAKVPATTTAANTMLASKPAFSFGSPAATSAFSAPATTVATTTAATTTAAAVAKPMFSFGSSTASAVSSSGAPTATTTAAVTPAAATTTTTGLFGFAGGSSAAAKPLFGEAVSSSSSAMGTAPAPQAAASTTANVFGGLFGANTTTPMFGDASKVSSSTAAPSTTTTTTTTFGGFGATSAVSSGFGGADNKPTGTATPLFGNVASSTTTASSSTPSAPFAFGSSAGLGNSSSSSISAAPATTTTSGGSMQWPKNQFVFGSAASSSTSGNAAVADNQQPKPIFGTFGSAQPTQNSSTTGNSTTPASSLFGSQARAAAPPAFGSAPSAFGSNATQSSANLFGSAAVGASSSSAATTAPAFGTSTPFGSATSGGGGGGSTFGSAMAQQPTTTFGGFGAATNSNTAATDGASAAKKSEPAFQFGGQQNSSTQGAFNFGAPATPAFNFGATSAAPTFNFTGTTETQPTQQPFQFGASPTAPVFSFGTGTGTAETTPNAPFQFNAGAAPATTNIFAPAPAAGQAAAQQARRKIRQPIRRMTPR